MIELIIDGDPIVYRSGFASEAVTYEVVAEDEDGLLYERHFSSANERDQWFDEHPSHVKAMETKRRDVEPLDNCLYVVRSTLEGIQREVREKFGESVNTRVVLSGPGNFRYQIATIKPYKGNRDPSHVPAHYQAIRNYLTGAWGARVIHGREADDECSILAWGIWRTGIGLSTKYVVASIDKDLDQIPGWHYDYMKHVFYFQSEDGATAAFWSQVLSGDAGDNIPGCFRVGPVKAAELVTEWLDKWGLDEPVLWQRIVSEYRDSQNKRGCPYADRAAENVALETARLVYMQQRPGELWNPPGTPFGYVEGDKDD